MARAFPQSQPHDYAQEPQQGEWQALRGELVALLDQVEHQVARTSRQERGYPGLAERMRELRYQVGDIEPDDRHREALRSVKRAVDRFSDRDEAAYEGPARGQGYPPNPRDSLQSAIQEIRSRQMAVSAPAPQRASEPSHFDELARAVDGVSGRLERLEAELKTQSRSQSGNVKEIAEQVGQLSHVVELLAGAVGETGQVKRLEGQIASLARLVEQGPQVDLSALTRRLDDVSATVGRLADLQVQYASKVEGPSALKDGMASIEQGVRNVYDRIDAIEKHHALSPEAVDRLTDEMARFTEAMHHSVQPEALVELVDRLNARIAQIDSRHGDIGGLKADVQELRGAVLDAMEPRFAAIELQIEALSDRFAERVPDLSIGQLEAQVRQLVARMDQTGEQLTGIARMQVQPEPMPDLESLADLVAIRTSQAVAHSSAMGSAGLSTEGLNEIEARMSRVVKAATAKNEASEDFDGVRKSINEVNERLARMEASLTGRARQDDRADTVSAVTPATPALVAPVPAPRSEAPRGRSDAMPANPAEDAPLTDKPFPAMGPVRAALEAKNGPRMRHPGLGDEAPARPEAAMPPAAKPAGVRPEFDPAKVERPPRPQSSFDVQPPEAFAREPIEAAKPVAAEAPAATAASVAPAASTAPAAPAAPASTNTFIAAARRAAQRQLPESGGKPARTTRTETKAAAKSAGQSGPGSLITRALSSFQAGRKAGDSAEQAEAAKAPKGRRKLAGDKQARTEWKPDDDAPRVEPSPAPAPPSIDSVGDQSAQPMLTEVKHGSFLRRHSKVVLLGVSVVVLSLLTLNLVNQRLAGDRAAPPKDAAPAKTSALTSLLPAKPAGSLADLPGTPHAVPTVDTLATASIDPAAARGFMPSTAVPEMPRAFTAAAAAPPAVEAAERVAELPPLAETVAPLPDLVTPVASPVKVELPPAAIGPEALRQAAANGDPRAQFEVAAIYTEGRAVGEDLQAAAVWYERSAAQGFAPAQYRLGNLYENGRGVVKDLDQARLWYQRAAEAGNRMSMHNLAALYAGGEFGKQQFDSAAEWFEQAAERGLKDSQFNLGMLYARGLGVPQDLEKSYKWFSIAARNGDADAAKARDDVARSLDADAVGRLNAEVAAWKTASIDLAANFAPIGTWSDTFDPGDTIANQDVVKSVQMALGFLGYDVGTPDGLAGPKTAEAIKSFERATGMSESGAINPRLLAVLGSQPV